MIESEVIDARCGEPHVTPEQIADVNIGTYGSDNYVLSTGNKVKAELITNNSVRVYDGVMVYGGIRDAIPVNKYYDVAIDNGAQGKNRNDIIVRRYTKEEGSSGKASAVFAVVNGTATTGAAADPVIADTDIRAGALTHDMPLHRIRLEGLNIVAVEPLFNVLCNMAELQEKYDELNSNITNSTNYSFSETVWANPTYSIIKKNGRIDISYYCVVSGGVAAKEFPIARLPQGTIPSSAIQFAGWVADTTGNRHAASIKIATTGLISLIAGSNFVEAGFAISYPV